MNLLFGSQNGEAYNRLTDYAAQRYDQPQHQAWASPSCSVGYLRGREGDPVGTASDQATGVSLAILGVINHGEKGLATSPQEDAAHALNFYLSEGLEGLTRLEGQFILATFDPRSETLYILPDTNGMRTAYYFEKDGALSFASNLGTLAGALKERTGIDETYQNFFLSHGFFPFNQTAFKGIKQIPPKHILIAGESKLTLRQLPSRESRTTVTPAPDFSSMDEASVIDELHEGFKQAVREQLTPDPKVGILLGGFDSALVAAYLVQAGKEVHTYSFHYEDARYNQAHTDTVASHLGCTHHWIPINAEVIAQGIKNFDAFFNAPTNWLNYVIQTETVCRQIREDGIRHVYSGDGCDAAFLGYPNVHTTSMLFKRLGRWPHWLTNGLTRLLDRAWLENLTGRPYTVGMHLLRTLSREMPERGFLTFRIFDANSIRHMKAPYYHAAEQSDEALLKQIAAPLKGKSPDRIAYGGKGFLSPNRSKIIGSSDSTGVVIQAPYLHPKFKALALSLPDELCRPSGKTEAKEAGKYILMRMAEVKGMLPREAIYQKKFAAVDAPVDDWLKEDLKQTGKEMLEELPFTIHPAFRDALFERKFLEELHRRHIASDSLTTHGLSLLLTYSRFTRLVEKSTP
jgi:asparagine synthase (glutamine-hydrolysing)